MPGPTPGSHNRLFAVQAIAPDDVWASGGYRPEGSGATHSLYLHWDGSSWTQIPAPAESGGFGLLYRPGPGDLISSGGIYGGDGIFRWDGSSWGQVMDFSGLANPMIVALGLVPGTDCEIWGVGRSNGPPAGGLTVHLDPEPAGSIEILEPCTAPAPPESLSASPPPSLGLHVSFAVDDPMSAATVAPGSLAVLALGNPLPSSCGTVVPGLGADLAAGELLIADTAYLLSTATWGGPGTPAVFDVPIPSQPVLAGFAFAAQAALVASGDGDLVLTRGLLLTAGN